MQVAHTDTGLRFYLKEHEAAMMKSQAPLGWRVTRLSELALRLTPDAKGPEITANLSKKHPFRLAFSRLPAGIKRLPKFASTEADAKKTGDGDIAVTITGGITKPVPPRRRKKRTRKQPVTLEEIRQAVSVLNSALRQDRGLDVAIQDGEVIVQLNLK